MYDARVIANEVLRMAWREDVEITQIDIQKICYFLNGHHLVDHGEPMINSDFEAWRHGPVQRTLYAAFRDFGAEPITRLATSFDPIRRRARELSAIESNSVRDTIAKYLPVYLDLPSFELVDLTHQPNTPWSKTRQDSDYSANLGMRIKTETIRELFEGYVVS